MAHNLNKEIKGHLFPSLIPGTFSAEKTDNRLHDDGEVAIMIGGPANKVVLITKDHVN